MIFAANFKMNHTRASTLEYLTTLESALECRDIANDEIFVFPPATALCNWSGSIIIGAQNAYMQTNGAYTGEIGLEQLEEFGIDTILIGHSERRSILGESQEFIAKKYEWFKEHNFRIIYCIGEPLEVRESGDEAVAEYLWEQFEGIDIDYDRLIVAYEPVWAIGTGLSANSEQIASIHGELRKRVSSSILYGGSVKPNNAKEILSIDNVDGVLVGSASLKVESFLEMIDSAKSSQ